jgi:hypothetical protein
LARTLWGKSENLGMNVLLLGATGMVGQGMLRECLLNSDVQLVQTVGQTDTGAQDFEARFLFPSCCTCRCRCSGPSPGPGYRKTGIAR